MAAQVNDRELFLWKLVFIPLGHRLILIQMLVYMSSLMNACKHIYTINLYVCVCVYVHIQESSSLVDAYLSRTY